MADVVTGPTILSENDKRVVIKIVNQSDGNGGTTVFGDVSAMASRRDGTAVAHLGLLRIWFSCQGGDGGIPVIGLTGTGYWDFRDFGGIPADKSNNTNESDVNLVVPGTADAANMYTIVAEFQKIY